MKVSKWLAEVFHESPLPRWLCWLITIICSGYACLTFILSIAPDRPPILMFPVYFLLFFCGVVWLWKRLLRVKLKGDSVPSLKTRYIIFGVMLLYGGIVLLCGMFTSPDTDTQWNQVLACHFDDWHPVIHTMCIWLFAQVIESQLFVVLIQCFIFALLCGWLYQTLLHYHYRKAVVYGVLAFICLSPLSLIYLRLLWKDVAFALAGLALTIILVHLWHTKGVWLLKPWRFIAFVVVLILASFYRHNGIFLTIPFCLLLPFLYKGLRYKVASVGLVVLAFLCLGGYVLFRQTLIQDGRLISAQHKHQNFSEAVGLPMSMMGQAFISHPEKVSQDLKDFLLTMGCEDDWKLHWKGDFNSVKFRFNEKARDEGRLSSGQIIYQLGASKFFRLFIQTCIAVPTSTIKAFLHVTSLGWSPITKEEFVGVMQNSKFLNNELNFLLRTIFHFQPFNWIFGVPGMHLLLIILFGGFALVRFGWKSCILFMPYVSYALGTALLLTGWDHRFFFVLSLCLAPVLCLCLTKSQEE